MLGHPGGGETAARDDGEERPAEDVDGQQGRKAVEQVGSQAITGTAASVIVAEARSPSV